MRHVLLIGVAGVSLVATPAQAEFSKKIATAVCATAQTSSEDVRKSYLDTFFTQNPLPVSFSQLGEGESDFSSTQSLTDRLITCRPDGTDSCKAFAKVRTKLFADLSEIFRGRDKYFKSSNGPTVSLAGLANLETVKSVLDLKNGTIHLECRQSLLDKIKADSSTNVEQTSDDDSRFVFARKFAISKNADSVGSFDPDTKTFKAREAAQFAVTLDRENKINVAPAGQQNIFVENEVFQADLAMSFENFLTIRRGDLDASEKGGVSYDFHVSPYVGLQYKTNLDNEKETDNLSFGLKATQVLPRGKSVDLSNLSFLDLRAGLDQYSVTAAYITDVEQRESRQWYLDGKTQILSGGFRNVPGLQTNLGLTAVLDYSQIDEFGDKVSLKDIGEFIRIGYDANFDALYKVTDGLQLGMGLKYQLRETVNNEDANVDFITANLSFKPITRSDTELSYGIVYERGEVITSLEDVEIWKLSVGFKR